MCRAGDLRSEQCDMASSRGISEKWLPIVQARAAANGVPCDVQAPRMCLKHCGKFSVNSGKLSGKVVRHLRRSCCHVGHTPPRGAPNQKAEEGRITVLDLQISDTSTCCRPGLRCVPVVYRSRNRMLSRTILSQLQGFERPMQNAKHERSSTSPPSIQISQ